MIALTGLDLSIVTGGYNNRKCTRDTVWSGYAGGVVGVLHGGSMAERVANGLLLGIGAGYAANKMSRNCR